MCKVRFPATKFGKPPRRGKRVSLANHFKPANSVRHAWRVTLGFGLALGIGCSIHPEKANFCKDGCLQPSTLPACGPTYLQLSRPHLQTPCVHPNIEAISPLDLNESSLTDELSLPMTLDQCFRQALATSKVMRDLGGTVVRAPQVTGTTFEPALTYTDPRVGEEAALSAFDANLFANTYFDQNDRRLNNQFFGNNGLFNQDLNVTQWGVNKRSATGGLFTFRNITTYDRNNQLSNALGPRSWETYVDAEARQSLLQGAGTEFNRIAGPGATPGQFNGVLLARVRADLSLTEFERAVRDLVADVENAYWDLYYAYRDLEAKIEARDIAVDTLNKLDETATSRGNKAQAEEQVFRFQSDIIDALNGRPFDGTRTNNGSSGGSFRGIGGLRIAERKLRLMIGLPINDGRLIRTTDTPTVVPVLHDWSSGIAEALDRREELRRQRWVIKQRELELVANRNFLKPQLDLVGRYRLRGFDDDLFGPSSATANLTDGTLQEWQMGIEYNLPVGFRRAYSAVRNSQLALVREVEILKEQERYVTFGLSNAINECKRAFENMNLQYSRLDAIVTQLNSIQAKSDQGEKAELDVRLETHRRLLDARQRYHQAQVEYVVALRNVHYEKGTLLHYCNISLSESISSSAAHRDATQRRQFQDYQAAPAVRDAIIAVPVTQ